MNATPPPICYLQDEFIPFSDARLPVYDLAIMQGASVTERLRTFRHKPYDVDAHLQRLANSLSLVGWKDIPDVENLRNVIDEVAGTNCKTIAEEADLSIVIFVTAGQALGDANGLCSVSKPVVCVYSALLPFEKWDAAYNLGVKLIVPSVSQIPATTVSPKIKMRSRLHWQLADQSVREVEPDAMAILLDANGFLTETSSGNLMIVSDGVVLTPSEQTTLNGISRQHVCEICERLGIPTAFANLTIEQVQSAEEAFLTSSTYCILPIRSLNQTVLKRGIADREVTQRIIRQWASDVGVDFVQQAEVIASR